MDTSKPGKKETAWREGAKNESSSSSDGDSEDEVVGGGGFSTDDEVHYNNLNIANALRGPGELQDLQFQNTINKSFIAVEPTDSDLDGMTAVLKQLFKSVDLDVSEFAKILVSQNYVTTILKGDDEDEVMEDDGDDGDNETEDDTVYGLYGIINLKAKKNNTAIKKLLNFLKSKCSSGSVEEDTEELFVKVLNFDVESNIEVGLLIKEKIVNIPGAASIPSLFQLRNDMKTATSNGMKYKFDYFIHLAKVIVLDGKSKGKTANNNGDYYVDEEDEMLLQDLTVHFDIKFPETMDDKVKFATSSGKSIEGKQILRVFLIPDMAFNTWLEKLKKEDVVKPIMDEACASGLVI